jgi:hypothetical protein
LVNTISTPLSYKFFSDLGVYFLRGGSNDWGDKDKYYNKVLRFGTYLENKKVSFALRRRRRRKEDSKYLIRYTTLEDLQNPDKYGEAKEYDETMELVNPRNKEKKIPIKEFNKVFKD